MVLLLLVVGALSDVQGDTCAMRGYFAVISPRILAAGGKVTASYSSYTYGGALGRKVMIFAGTVY